MADTISVNLVQAMQVPTIRSSWSFGRRPHGDRSKILKGATDMEHERMADREKMETIVQKMAEPHR